MNKPTLYLDMDGVLVDFLQHMKSFGYDYCVERSHTKLKATMDANWSEIFKDCPALPHAENLLALYKQYPGRVKFLTAVPVEWEQHRQELAELQKIRWIKQHLPEADMNDVIVVTDSAHKQNYVKHPNDLLVDDFERNIQQWQAAGGTAYQYDTNCKSADEILKMQQELLIRINSTIL